MTPRLTAARHVAEHRVWLRFDDGTEGELDLAGDLHGPVFEPLRDPRIFGRLRLHPELRTLVWENGADLAPEFLYERLRAAA